MIAKIYTAIPQGYDGRIIEVEGDINQGLPGINIVGMANKTISEARERVRSAITNSGYSIPPKKITVNLAPAELEKDGSQLDLPIALAILVLAKQISPHLVEGCLFVGELSLDGKTRPVRGIINIIEAAKQSGFQRIFIPVNNLTQASLVKGIEIIGVESLSDLVLILTGVKPAKCEHTFSKKHYQSAEEPTLLEHISGQNIAKRALTIAIAGRHNILFSGPPGAGKTLLARAAHSLLPSPSPEEQISITKIHSLSSVQDSVHLARPFRSPHHTASVAAIIGGGNSAMPGEISLANTGILFLDEMPEFPKSVLEALRQPLEDKEITVSRAKSRFTYPADFILIATMNPCPCGYLGDQTHECTCNPTQIANYRRKISGPIFDRVDITLQVERVKTSELMNKTSIKNEQRKRTKSDNQSNTSMELPDISSQITTDQARTRIKIALERQYSRYKTPIITNGNLNAKQIAKHLKIAPEARELLNTAADKLNLSARAYFKTLKVAQTIADLDEIDKICPEQISEALSFRHQI